MSVTTYMSPGVLAETLIEMSSKSITGTASRIKEESLGFICSRLPDIPVDADHETINLRLLRLAAQQPQHFHPDLFNDLD